MFLYSVFVDCQSDPSVLFTQYSINQSINHHISKRYALFLVMHRTFSSSVVNFTESANVKKILKPSGNKKMYETNENN